MQVTLYKERSSRIEVTIWAELNDECLKISGQEFGSACIEKWGYDEHEYSYRFDMQNTRRLYVLLSKDIDESSLLKLIAENYSGINGLKRLQEICDSNDIKYTFTSR